MRCRTVKIHGNEEDQFGQAARHLRRTSPHPAGSARQRRHASVQRRRRRTSGAGSARQDRRGASTATTSKRNSPSSGFSASAPSGKNPFDDLFRKEEARNAARLIYRVRRKTFSCILLTPRCRKRGFCASASSCASKRISAYLPWSAFTSSTDTANGGPCISACG